jgi:hypothetical protein
MVKIAVQVEAHYDLRPNRVHASTGQDGPGPALASRKPTCGNVVVALQHEIE